MLTLILCLSIVPPITSHAQELAGRTFTADELLAVEKPLAAAPRTLEAWVCFPQNTNASTRGGVILGNYHEVNRNVLSFEIYSGGYPRLYTADENGRKAQLFKSYRTNALVNASMTGTHRSYLSNIDAVSFGNHNQILQDMNAPLITWAGKSLSLDSKVSLKYVFTPGSYTGKIENLTLRVHYVNYAGVETETVIAHPVLYRPEANAYAFTFDGLLAAELRTVLDAAIYDGNTRLSQTLRYSADTYGNHKTGQLLTLCKALFSYSDSAKVYFGG